MSNDFGTLALPANFDENLINLVRQNPILYAKDKRMKPYETIQEKSEIRALWQSIATTLGVEPNYCLIRWKQLQERYRRESQLQKQIKNTPQIVDTKFMEKMNFLASPSSHSHKLICHKSNDIIHPNVAPVSENIFGVINYEYLPEAMEAQSQGTNIDNTTQTMAPHMSYAMRMTSTNSVLTRIKALLEGLDAVNREKAEKRVLSYLCKCQLKALENESIDDVNF